MLEIPSLASNIYHWTPPSNRQIYLYPGETDIVKFYIIPLRSPRKIIPLAKLVSMDILLKDIIFR